MSTTTPPDQVLPNLTEKTLENLWEYHAAMALNMQVMHITMDALMGGILQGDTEATQRVSILLRHLAIEKSAELPVAVRGAFADLIELTQRRLLILAR